MTSDLTKKCVACAEEIQLAALLCKHCRTDQRDSRFAAKDIERKKAVQPPPPPNSSAWKEGNKSPVGPVAGEVSPKVPSQSPKVTFWAIVAVVGLGLAFLVSSQPPTQQAPEVSVRQQSYEIGFQAGKSLRAQNRQLLFYDPERECADAFTLYSLDRDLDFDRFFSGCVAGWK